MTSPATPPEKEGRLARKLRAMKQIRDKPSSALSLARGWLLDLWLSRGGGFYGLGFAVTFVTLEILFIFDDVRGSDSVYDFVAQEMLEFVFRIGYQSIINLVQAIIWPVLLLERLGVWAFALLAAGYLGFEYLARPLLEARLPELRDARVNRENKKREKAEKKKLKKANRKPKEDTDS